MNRSVRVRFAPSPTGFMHLGNVRTALMNYLFALHYKGTNILRIEDTDQHRMFDQGVQAILHDLSWLSISFQEGPGIEGPHAPYYQSERSHLYQTYLSECIERGAVYRCFCSAEELEQKRNRQIAQKLPPRYDRACLKIDKQTLLKRGESGHPFIWRYKVPETTVTIHDLARGYITYDLKNFSDFPLTRQDGSFTFIFANFVDDVMMEITHVIRGEDHLSNTANQAALYSGLDKSLPIFWHLPIITNTEGKKLSKRDFGFSLSDLRQAGYLPEAINNYLALLGTAIKSDDDKEIMSVETIGKLYNFEHISATGQIKYDIEKLRWMNQQWIQKISFEDFKERIKGLIPASDDVSFNELLILLKPELMTLNDVVEKVKFYTSMPSLDISTIPEAEQRCILFLRKFLIASNDIPDSAQDVIRLLTEQAAAAGIKIKHLYGLLRLLLTGTLHGLAVKDIIRLLGTRESYKRFSRIITE